MKLPLLHVWDDRSAPRPGPENMAIDDALVARSLARPELSPILRYYCWDGDWWSVGYFQRSELRALRCDGKSVTRRRTGGGIVHHDAHEETYALVLPTASTTMNARDLYRAIHECLAAALRDCGVPAVLATSERSGRPGNCFDEPVPADVVDAESGAKLAGAAQRRSRGAILHQGSVRAPSSAHGRWQEAFADALAETVEPTTPDFVSFSDAVDPPR